MNKWSYAMGVAVRWRPPARIVVLALAGLAGCGGGAKKAPVAPAAGISKQAEAVAGPKVEPEPSPLRFRADDLPFRYDRGESGVALPAETNGGGVAMLDYDRDGDLDLFFPQGVPLPPRQADPASWPTDVLLRNDKGHFTDVSSAVGLTPKGHGQGVTAADYDADGDTDIYVTRYGSDNTLWRNDGGHFTDATVEAGVSCKLWSLGAAFFDYDNDGDLDLFISNYFYFDPSKAPFLRDPKSGAAMYGAPAEFPGQPDVLFRNEGNGRFRDVTAEAGVAGEGRGMGVLAADLDGDGRMDILASNDAEANVVWRNLGDGRFEDVALIWGLAFNGQGLPEANMGNAHGDTDGDGLQDIVITHFYDEHDTLWRPEPTAAKGTHFRDATYEAGLGVDSRPYTGWGTVLADFDQDGYLDLIVTNGHIRPEPSQTFHYECPPILWRGRPAGKFQNVTTAAGPYFQARHLGRGLACGDLDGDGDLDLVIVQYNEPAVVLWNESQPRGHWLILDLEGKGANRDAVGAVVRATVGGRPIVHSIDGGGGYISAHDRRLHFGLGDAAEVLRLDVRWPDGEISRAEHVQAGAVLRWKQGDPAGPVRGPSAR